MSRKTQRDSISVTDYSSEDEADRFDKSIFTLASGMIKKLSNVTSMGPDVTRAMLERTRAASQREEETVLLHLSPFPLSSSHSHTTAAAAPKAINGLEEREKWRRPLRDSIALLGSISNCKGRRISKKKGEGHWRRN